MTSSEAYKSGMLKLIRNNIYDRSALDVKLTNPDMKYTYYKIRYDMITSGGYIPMSQNQKIMARDLYKVPEAELWPDGDAPTSYPTSSVNPLSQRTTTPTNRTTGPGIASAPASGTKPVAKPVQPAVTVKTGTKPADNMSYHILWRSALVDPKAKVTDIDISKVTNDYTQNAMIDALLSRAITANISVPLNSGVAMTQEYSPSVQNKIVQYTTLAGNSTTNFGQGPKKIALKISIIKAGRIWVNYLAAFEALHMISSNPGRYFGNIYLYGYDTESTNLIPRKYKVTLETLSFSNRSDKNNIIDVDLTMIVNHDYSIRPMQNSGQWGRL